MQTFDQALYEHVAAGRVTLEDALVAASSPHDFKLLLEAQGKRGTTMADVPDDTAALRMAPHNEGERLQGNGHGPSERVSLAN